MKIIGLTGSIGTGKSTVANYLKESNISVINLDDIAHQTILKGNKAYNKIVNEFGNEILDDNGEIDRKQLGVIVFDDVDKLEKLNSFTHPEVLETLAKQIAINEISGESFIVVEVPLLFELNLERLFDEVVVVFTPLDKQIERVRKRDNISEEEAIKRINLQIPVDKKISDKVLVVDNSKGLPYLKEQVDKLVNQWENIY